jgi:hypothetical protein
MAGRQPPTPRPPAGPRPRVASTYDVARTRMSREDVNEIEHAGRRCAVCHSGRGWRRFEIVRPAERDPVVLCGSCRARFGEDPPVGRKPEPAPVAPEAAPASEAPSPEAPSPAQTRARGRATERRPDRLRAALRKMPSSFSTATAARAAGLSSAKTLARLQDLERRGELQRLGNRWSAEPPASDLASAMDRLEARTTNLRIVRSRTRAD